MYNQFCYVKCYIKVAKHLNRIFELRELRGWQDSFECVIQVILQVILQVIQSCWRN